MTPIKTLRIFLPFAFGFYLSYLYRSVNAVISPDLIRDIGVDAANLGLLSSAYFIAFASAQIPLGIILDHMGPRKVEASLLVFGALGALIFAFSDTL
ncbi:MAG: MFS transporter, partial [Rhodospirillales bacterium]|nr:MFS transporter [Rhodospirillales bacterium]